MQRTGIGGVLTETALAVTALVILSSALAAPASAESLRRSSKKASGLSQLSFEVRASGKEAVEPKKAQNSGHRAETNARPYQRAHLSTAQPPAKVKPESSPSREPDKQEIQKQAASHKKTAANKRGSAAVSGRSITVLFSALDSGKSRYGLLTPRPQGPQTDAENPAAISGSFRWSPAPGAACADPQTDEALRSKAEALREVLLRFSGTLDFYTGLEQEICAPRCSGKSSVIGFAVDTAKGGSFEMVQENESCFYRITRPQNGQWVVLEGHRAVCACR